MIDLDAERDARVNPNRTFKIGGEEFTFKPGLAPEALTDYFRVHKEPDTPDAEVLRVLDQTVLKCLEAGQEDKWLKVRDPDLPYPITATDIYRVINVVIEGTTGRPFEPQSGSGNGQKPAETTSKESSPSEEATPTA